MKSRFKADLAYASSLHDQGVHVSPARITNLTFGRLIGRALSTPTRTSIYQGSRLTVQCSMARSGISRPSPDGKTTESLVKQGGVFDFFNLPRELRDQIYADCLQFKVKFESQHGVRLRGRRVAQGSLLQINHQFRHEYLERAEKETCLVIVDRDHFHGEALELPTPVKYTRKLELHLALACDSPDHVIDRCKVVQEVRMHRKWIGDLADRMKHLNSISIKVLLDNHPFVRDCGKRLLSEQHRFTNLEALTSVEVYHCDFYQGDNGTGAWNFQRSRKLVMQWSPGKSELQRVEGVAAAKEREC